MLADSGRSRWFRWRQSQRVLVRARYLARGSVVVERVGKAADRSTGRSELGRRLDSHVNPQEYLTMMPCTTRSKDRHAVIGSLADHAARQIDTRGSRWFVFHDYRRIGSVAVQRLLGWIQLLANNGSNREDETNGEDDTDPGDHPYPHPASVRSLKIRLAERTAREDPVSLVRHSGTLRQRMSWFLARNTAPSAGIGALSDARACCSRTDLDQARVGDGGRISRRRAARDPVQWAGS